MDAGGRLDVCRGLSVGGLPGVHLRDLRRSFAESMKTVTFVLPRILPLLNVRDRTHWAKRRREKQDLAWEIASVIGPRPKTPIKRARVTIERWSTGTPDTDGVWGSAKALVDVLCAPSRTHPCGLGVIVDDHPGVCELRVHARKAAHREDQRTVVTVEALPP